MNQDLSIEFGDYLLNNLELFDNWSKNKNSTEYCFNKFIYKFSLTNLLIVFLVV